MRDGPRLHGIGPPADEAPPGDGRAAITGTNISGACLQRAEAYRAHHATPSTTHAAVTVRSTMMLGLWCQITPRQLLSLGSRTCSRFSQ
ncbi:MAG: hypothetical protein ACJAVR_004073 [Paracoccaceae bacterium]